MKKNTIISLAILLIVFLVSCNEKTDIYTENNNGSSLFSFDTSSFFVEAEDYTGDEDLISNFDLTFTDFNSNTMVISIYGSTITDKIEDGTYYFSVIEKESFTFYDGYSSYYTENEEDNNSFTDGTMEITHLGEDSYTLYLDVFFANGDSLTLNYSGDIPIDIQGTSEN